MTGGSLDSRIEHKANRTAGNSQISESGRKAGTSQHRRRFSRKLDWQLTQAPGHGPSFTQAGAQEWQPFGIERFGFVFEVPPEFELARRSEDGDGAAFLSPEGDLFAVWGLDLERDDFLPQVRNHISQDEKDGWKFSYRRLKNGWASYSGTKVNQIRYVRAITVCGDRAAFFLMDYSKDRKVAYDPVVTRMVRSLKPEGC